MIARLRELVFARTFAVPFALSAIVLGVVVGRLLAVGNTAGVIVSALAVGLVLFLIRPINAAILALLAVYATQRLGTLSASAGSTSGISYSDAILVVAALLGLINIIGTEELKRQRAAVIACTVYLACLIPTIIANTRGRALLEFPHRVVMVLGAMCVGAWLVREGKHRQAVRAFILLSVVVAVLAIENSLAHGLQPATPLTLNKNLVGAQMATAAVLLLSLWTWLDVGRRVGLLSLAVLFAGVGFSQSRGSIVGALVALFLAVVFRASLRRASVRIAVVLVAAAIAVPVYLSVKSQLTAQDANLNALGVRFNVEKRTREIWRTSPVDGVGLKYFNTGTYGALAQPANNVIDNELAESGLLGAIGFAVFQVGAIGAGLRRRHDPLAITGGAIVAGQLVHGMVDIYWIGGFTSLPFVLLGMGLATRPTEPERPVAPPVAAADAVGAPA